MSNKAIIISAPSGAGKTTIVRRILETIPQLEFSVSACSRPRRGSEVDGQDYFFLSVDEFRGKIKNNEFLEWEEVYPGSFYGTLNVELDRIWKEGKIPVFDVDVVGGDNLKKQFGDSALAIFIRPPSLQVLEQRLRDRATDDEESLRKRLAKAEQEMAYAGKFDAIVVNDDLERATVKAEELVKSWIMDARYRIPDAREGIHPG